MHIIFHHLIATLLNSNTHRTFFAALKHLLPKSLEPLHLKKQTELKVGTQNLRFQTNAPLFFLA